MKADTLLFLMLNYNESGHVNVGTGIEYSILEYARMVKKTVGFAGEIVHDLGKPDGMPLKQLDVSKINEMGWKASTGIGERLRLSYEWFSGNYELIIR